MYEDAIIKKYQTSLNPDSKPHEIEKFFNDISQDKEFPGIHIVRDLISTLENYELDIPSGKLYYRARIVDNNDTFRKLSICENQVYGLVPDESTAPQPDKANAGRANPKGIPCLYLADDRYTAISEVNPYHLSIINVARFQLNTSVKLVDMSKYSHQHPNNKGPLRASSDKEMIKALSFSFSKPYRFEKEEHYLPTQYIAHRIKTLKERQYDGIAYSSLKSNGGMNIVLFDKSHTTFCDSELVRCYGMTYNIQNITYESDQSPCLKKDFSPSSQADIQEIKKKIIQVNSK